MGACVQGRTAALRRGQYGKTMGPSGVVGRVTGWNLIRNASYAPWGAQKPLIGSGKWSFRNSLSSL